MSFMNTKGNKPGTTVLTYLLGNVLKQKPEILDFSKEFDVLGEASKINMDSKLNAYLIKIESFLRSS